MEIERFVGIECQLEQRRQEMATLKETVRQMERETLKTNKHSLCCGEQKIAHNNGTAAKRRVANFKRFFYVRIQLSIARKNLNIW